VDEGVVRAAALISTVLACYCWVPYVRSVLRGDTRPHRLSWTVFLMMDAMVVGAQVLAGGRLSVLVSAVGFLFAAVITALAFWTHPAGPPPKNGLADWTLFAGAVVAMGAWALTRSNTLAVWLTVAVDLFATAMIVMKVHREPGSEAVKPWAIGTAAYAFSCITLASVHPGILYVRPVYGLVADAALVGVLVLAGRGHRSSIGSMDRESDRGGLRTGAEHANAV
jgi:hypothetical protein